VIDPWDVIWAALLHDVGKIALPRRLLWQPSLYLRGLEGRDGHPEETRLLLRAVPGLGHLALAAATHHERYQGGGPIGLAGEQIPLVGRILAIADRYDTLKTRGLEGRTRTHLEVAQQLQRDAGPVLDRRLTEVALGVFDQVDRQGLLPRGPLTDWRQLAAGLKPPPAGEAPQRPIRKGSLLIDLEPWTRVRLRADLSFQNGAQEFFALAEEQERPRLCDTLSEESAGELESAAPQLLPGDVFSRYLFTKDRRPLEAVLQREGDGFSLLVRSAENRLQTLDRLALFYRSFLSSYEAVVFTDPTGRIIDVNRCFLDLFGYKLGEIVGQHTRVLGSGKHAGEFYQRMWAALTDPAVGHWSGELVDRRRDGREVHVQLRINAVRDSSGACMGYVAHHLDITGRKQAEAEARRRDEDLRASNAELVRLSQFKNEVIALTSHDLKAPLSSIAGIADLLREGMQALSRDRVEAYLERISSSARGLISFIDDLLDLEKMESGALRLDRGRLHLGALVSRCLERAGASARGKVGLELRPSAAGAPVLLGDPVRLEQVFDNLLANAIKFSPPGGVVTASVEPVGTSLRVCVEDEGPGIPPAHLSRIFDRYHQVDRAGVPKRGFGAGLGLSIVKQLVGLHGGQVWAENRATGGCRMVVELPVDLAPAHLRPVAVLASPLSAQAAELLELLAMQGFSARRVDALQEASQLVRILDAEVLVVGEGLLTGEGKSLLDGTQRIDGRPPLLVLFSRGQGDELNPPAGFEASLSAPFLDDEIRALLSRARA
jgi:PAS domain S-box-containing protein